MHNRNMKALVATNNFPADFFDPVEVELHPLGETEVRVEVDFAGVNYWDIMQMRGDAPLPASRIPGVEGSGRVQAVGARVTNLIPGDRVAWSKVSGSYAESVQAEQGWFIPVPEGVSQEQAAAAIMQGTTAWYLAHQVVPIKSGDVAVVLAAAGGVGHLLIQLLIDLELAVVGVVGNASKAPMASAAGAGVVIVDSEDLVADVLQHAPKGATVVFDANGGDKAIRNLGMLGVQGTVIYYGTAAGPLPKLDLADLSAGSLGVRRVRGADYLGGVHQWRLTASMVLSSVAAGALRSHVHSTLPLNDAALQHDAMKSRTSTGKLLLRVSGT